MKKEEKGSTFDDGGLFDIKLKQTKAYREKRKKTYTHQFSLNYSFIAPLSPPHIIRPNPIVSIPFTLHSLTSL